METIVRATCPTCGDVELKPADLELRICSTPAFSIYVFSCTTCDTLVAKPAADHRIVTLLSSVGVPMVRWDLPAELEETHEGPPLSLDDLIDLRLALETPDFVARLSRSVSA